MKKRLCSLLTAVCLLLSLLPAGALAADLPVATDPITANGSTKFYNAVFAEGKNVVVKPAAEGDGLSVTIGNTEFSYGKNTSNYATSSAADGLTIFAGYNNGDSAAVANSTIRICSGANVGAIFAGGYNSSKSGTVTVIVEKGASVGTIYGGGLTAYQNSTATVSTQNTDITIDGTVGILYAGGCAATGVKYDDVIKINDNTGNNYVGTSTVKINGTVSYYFGGSFSYGYVGEVSCTVSGNLSTGTQQYSGISGTNGYRGNASMMVTDTGHVGNLYCSMRGYLLNTTLNNAGTIDLLMLAPDGNEVASKGNTYVTNTGTITRCHFDCGCAKKSISNCAASQSVDPYPAQIVVDGNVTVSNQKVNENNYVDTVSDTTTIPENTTLILRNGATYAGSDISRVAVAQAGDQYYTSLAEAVEKAAENDITLLQDVTLAETLTIDKNVTIDLNGHTITGENGEAGRRVFHVKENTLTLTGEGTVTTAAQNDTNFSGSSSVIRVGDGANWDADQNSTTVAGLVIGKDVTILAPVSYGVSAFGSSTKESVEVSGKITVDSDASAVAGNGLDTYTATTITIEDGAELYSESGVAIYHPQSGTLTIGAASITGAGGIEAKGGSTTVTMTNAKITATGEPDHTANSNGNSSVGYAVAAVENKDYAGNPKVTINGGNYSGLVDILRDNEVTADKKASISITGGTFSSNPEAYVAEGYHAFKSGSGFEVKEAATVTFAANNGSGEMEPVIVAKDSSYTLPGCGFTAPEGKLFAGWAITADGSELIQPNGTYSVTADTTFYAIWKDIPPVSYTISFDANGGNNSMAPVLVEAGASYTLPACTFTAPKGQQFKQWALNSVDGVGYMPGSAYTVEADATFYAIWEEIPVVTYTVTFNSNGGSAVTGQTVNAGGKVTQPANPTKSGYNFAGWYTDSSLSTPWDFANGTVTGNVTLYAKWTAVSGGGSTGGGSSGGGGSSSGTTTDTTTNPDGSTTTTVTRPDGSTTETTKNPDGSTEVVETRKDGTVTTTVTDTDGNKTQTVEKTDGTSQVTVTNKDGSASTTNVAANGTVESTVTLPRSVISAAEGQAVALPMPAVSAAGSSSAAPTVTVNLPANTTAKVEVPVDNVTAGTVAVLVKADGTEEVIKTTLATENGVTVALSDGDTVKIVDNSKDFADVADSYWGADAVAFASSRELFNGTSGTTFSPDNAMTRAMVITVLARYEGVDTTAGSTWYEAGVQWAKDNGVSDGTNLDNSVTREQLVTMLYRYAGSPAVTGVVTGFADAGSISDWAADAMVWATQTGLLGGVGNNLIKPQGDATRAQVATILMRFISNIA